MSVLGDVRSSLLDLLEGVQTFPEVPARFNPPAVIVSTNSPYLASGDTFGTYRVQYVLSCVVGSGPNEVTTAALDDLIETVLLAVDGSWDIDNVSTFYAFNVNTATYLAADIIVADVITFKE